MWKLANNLTQDRERGNETTGYIKGREFLDKLSSPGRKTDFG